MHVGCLAVLELPEGYKGDFYEDVKAHLGAAAPGAGSRASWR